MSKPQSYSMDPAGKRFTSEKNAEYCDSISIGTMSHFSIFSCNPSNSSPRSEQENPQSPLRKNSDTSSNEPKLGVGCHSPDTRAEKCTSVLPSSLVTSMARRSGLSDI